MELGDKIADDIMNNVRELPAETRRILNEASDRISEYYELSREFVRENQVLVLVGATLVAGLTGFLLGRASKNPPQI